MLRIAAMAGLAIAPLVLVVLGFALYVYVAVAQGARTPVGTIAGLGVTGAASIVRDSRGIPHIRARNEHDLFFLDGYEQGTDRLFQLDLDRRLVAGRLAEVFGSFALAADIDARTYDMQAIAHAQLAALAPRERADLDAFADGVNAAMRTRPLPPEFRALFYRPEPWTAEDSLVASFATVLALTDSWDDVLSRADTIGALGPSAKDAFFPVTDPRYDSPTTERVPAPVAPLPALSVPYPSASPLYVAGLDARAGLGSNDFAAGAALTTTHRALLANDPHLELRIPGAWWLVDLEAPGYHAAGATLPGVPGVVLGHNAHVAWGATNGTVATVDIYRERFKSGTSDEYLAGKQWVHAEHRSESFAVRFASTVVHDYLRTRHGFVFEERGIDRYAAAWSADVDRRSALAAFDGLDRAVDCAAALRALAAYPGPPQNFVIADDSGRAGYVLAGEIPIDETWALTAHDGPSSDAEAPRFVPFARLPHIAPSARAFAFTANDRTYGKGYPYRLSAGFAPPYRAYQIARDLARPPYDVARFSAVQADPTSPGEAELARIGAAALTRAHADNDPDLREALAALRAFDGRVTSDSRGAVFVTALRRASVERLVRLHMPRDIGLRYVNANAGQTFVAVMRMLRDHPRGWVPKDDYDAFLVDAMREGIAGLRLRGQLDETWSDFGARIAQHPFAAFGFKNWNGPEFPGFGDAFSPHVQGPAIAQSFRAVWDVGNWRAGGLVIPLGESGEPGSAHYRDLAATWLAGTLVPFPFDDADVARDAAETLDLQP